jgi:hypothetical protein
MSETKEYNGWKNYESWNVAMWLSNDEPCYRAIVEFMLDYKGEEPYKEFIVESGLDVQATKDGAKYMDPELDYDGLNTFMREFAPEGTRS